MSDNIIDFLRQEKVKIQTGLEVIDRLIARLARLTSEDNVIDSLRQEKLKIEMGLEVIDRLITQREEELKKVRNEIKNWNHSAFLGTEKEPF